MHATLSWLSVGVSLALLLGYELRLLLVSRKDPAARARSAHSLLRGEWVRALSRQQGTEILAVQALRNSLMSATITASTAAVVLMGSLGMMVSASEFSRGELRPFSLRLLLEAALVVTLFSTYVFSAIAMRYYHHAGFAMSLPVGSLERQTREPLAVAYVQRAGVLYSISLRSFLLAAPVVVGLLSPLLMPLAALALVGSLVLYDSVPKPQAA